MKQIFTLIALLTGFSLGLQANTTYKITSNSNSSSVLPSYCGSCTITVSSGATLTMNSSVYCQNCTISGGTIKVTSAVSFDGTTVSNTTINATAGITLNNSGNSFNNVILNMSGSADFVANNALSITGSTFTFSNTSSVTSNGQLNLDDSHLYFNDNTTFLSNSSTVNLKTSQIVIGDGSKSSKAHATFYGTLNLVDATSNLILSNVNNYYSSWNNYTSASNNKSYNTTSNYQPVYNGGAVFGSSGPLPITVLPITISDLNGAIGSNNEIKISWTLSDVTGGESFQVERSQDGQHFSSLASPSLVQSSGNYAYTDESPFTGENDYRVKLISPDGTISYSKTIHEEISAKGGLHIFPNPATGGNVQIQLPTTQTAMVNVFTIDGKLLYMTSLSGQSQYSLHIPGADHIHQLVVRVISKQQSATFNLLNN